MKNILSLSFLFIFTCSFSISKNADSLLRATENYKNSIKITDSSAIRHLNQLSNIFWKKLRTDTAQLLAKRAFDMCMALSTSNNPVAVSFAKKELASSHVNLGNIDDERTLYAEALSHFLQALKIRLELKDEFGQAVALNNAGLILLNMENEKDALIYFKQAADLNKKIGNTSFLSRNLTNIGNIWYGQNNYSKALEYYEQSLALKIKINDQKGLALIYGNIGNVKEAMGELDVADSLYQKSIRIQRDLKNIKGLIMELTNISSLRHKQKKYKEEEIFITEALTLGEKIKDAELLTNIYLVKAGLDSVKHDFASAFKYIKLYNQFKDQIKNEEAGKKVLQLKMQYDFDKKEEQQKAEQEKKDAIATQKLVDEKNRRNYLAGGLLVMILLVLFIYRNYRDKKRINNELEVKNAIIEQKQKEILSSIQYAKRIQTAHLPNEKYVEKSLKKLQDNED